MNRVVPFSEIDNFNQVAKDLRGLLDNGENQDIAEQFPATVERYTATHHEAVTNLQNAQARTETGRHEQFLIFAGAHAVGLSVITTLLNAPEGINPTRPNISGFICNPYRGQGLGRLSIETRMDIVRRDFGGHAWTLVRDDNFISERLVLNAGFKKSGVRLEGSSHHNVYLYDKSIS